MVTRASSSATPQQLLNRLALVGGIGTAFCALVIVLLGLTQAERHATVSEAAQLLGYGVAAGASAWASLHAPSRRHKIAWLWITLAYACNVIAELIFGYYVSVLHNSNPFPTLADGFYLSFYPLMVIGLSMFPIARLSGLQRVESWIDAFIVAGATLGLGWYYLIAPQVMSHSAMDTPLPTIISSAYPVGDVILLFGLIALIIRRGFTEQPWMLLLIGGSLGSMVYADAAYQYFSLQGSYAAGTTWIDLFWVVSALLLAAAALVSPIVVPTNAAPVTTGGSVPSVAAQARIAVGKVALLGIPIVVIAGLTRIALPPIPAGSAYPVLEIIRAVLVLSFAIRLTLVMWRNAYLTGQLSQAFEQLEAQRQQLAQYTLELESGIEQLQWVQAQIAQGNMGVRIQGLEHSALHPYGQLMNRMFDRLENRVADSNQLGHIVALLHQLEMICQRLYQGERIYDQEWTIFTQTPLEQVASYLRYRSTQVK